MAINKAFNQLYAGRSYPDQAADPVFVLTRQGPASRMADQLNSSNDASSMSNSHLESADKIREKKRRFAQREQKILQATIELLMEQDSESVTVSAVAKQAGIGKGTIYKHFLSKQSVLLRIVEDYELSLGQALKQVANAGDTASPESLINAYFKIRLTDPKLDRLVQRLIDGLESQPMGSDLLANYYHHRSSNIDFINRQIGKLIASGAIDDAPIHFYYLAYWALAQGATDLHLAGLPDESLKNINELISFFSSLASQFGRSH